VVRGGAAVLAAREAGEREVSVGVGGDTGIADDLVFDADRVGRVGGVLGKRAAGYREAGGGGGDVGEQLAIGQRRALRLVVVGQAQDVDALERDVAAAVRALDLVDHVVAHLHVG